MSGPFVLVPIPITDAMVSSGTIAEPAAGEAVFVPATNYTVGQEVIVLATHRVYECLVAGVNATSPELTLTTLPYRWLDKRPTQRWAAFDAYISTQSAIVTPMTYVLRPGIFNAIAMYGLEGATLSVSVKDMVGGTVIYSNTVDLIEPPIDHYDYYFGRIKSLFKVLCRNIVPFSDPELTITITAGAGVTVKAGMIAIGDLRSLLADETKGGVQYGAKAKPTSFSYITTDDFGVTKISRRGKATDMDIRIIVPNSDTDTALSTIQEVLDIPAAWIGSDAAGFTGLNVFGLASGDVSYEGPKHSTIGIQVKGTV